MAIKVIAQLREVKLGKNPGKKFVMRPDLYVPISDSDCTGCHVLYGTVKWEFSIIIVWSGIFHFIQK